MSVKIAICDDDLNDLHALETLIRLCDTGNQFEILAFHSSVSLYDSPLLPTLDILLLDIEMEPPNGFEIARRLAKLPEHPLIIFVTNNLEYATRGYGVAFRYLPKPVSLPQLKDVINAAILEVCASHFSFKTDRKDHFVRFQDIYYFEVYGHYTTLHLSSEKYTLRLPLKAVSDQLPPIHWAMPHKSYLVNLAHVRNLTSQCVKLDNGVEIPISRHKLQEFHQAIYAYFGR